MSDSGMAVSPSEGGNDNEPGHREGCGRHASEVSIYVAGLVDDDLVAPGSAQDRPELPYPPSLYPLPGSIELG